MSSPLCLAPKCDRPTAGGFICSSCVDFLRKDLRAIPGLWKELQITITRQANITRDRVGARSTTKPLPWNENAAQTATDLWSTINAWALDLERRGDTDRERDPLSAVSDEPADVARWLLRNLVYLNVHDEAGRAADEIGDAVRRATRCVDLPVDRVFAGPCGERIDDEVLCTEDLYGIPGRAELRCMFCRALHDFDKRRESMLLAIEDEVAYSGLLAGLVTSLGVSIASSTIRYYASKGRLKVISVDARKRPLYRIGDVLDVFLKRAA